MVVEPGGDDVQRVDDYSHHKTRENGTAEVGLPGACLQLSVGCEGLINIAAIIQVYSTVIGKVERE